MRNNETYPAPSATDATKIPLATVTAAGDLIVASGSGAVTNLAKGSDGDILKIISGAVAWSTPTVPSSLQTTISTMVDGDYFGDCIIDTTAAFLAFGDVLYLSGSGWNAAQADADVAMPCQGLCIEGGAAGSRKILTRGYVRNNSWSFTKGALLYVSTAVAGQVMAKPTSTGNRVQPVGVALATNILYFNPAIFWITV